MHFYRNRSMKHNLQVQTDLLISEKKETTNLWWKNSSRRLHVINREKDILKSDNGMAARREWQVLEHNTACIDVWDPQPWNICLSLQTSVLFLYWRRAERKCCKELFDTARKKIIQNPKVWSWQILLKKDIYTCPLSYKNWQIDASPNTTGKD